MLEIHLISSIVCFILMTICIKIIDGRVTVKDLLFNFITSNVPIVNIVILLHMLLALGEKKDFLDKKVF